MSALVFRYTKSRRCPYCERRWPPADCYTVCPACREETRAAETEPTLTSAQALAEAAYFNFGWWLWDTGRA